MINLHFLERFFVNSAFCVLIHLFEIKYFLPFVPKLSKKSIFWLFSQTSLFKIANAKNNIVIVLFQTLAPFKTKREIVQFRCLNFLKRRLKTGLDCQCLHRPGGFGSGHKWIVWKMTFFHVAKASVPKAEIREKLDSAWLRTFYLLPKKQLSLDICSQISVN